MAKLHLSSAQLDITSSASTDANSRHPNFCEKVLAWLMMLTLTLIFKTQTNTKTQDMKNMHLSRYTFAAAALGLCLTASSLAANLIPINPGAESNNFDGWGTFGTDASATATINSNTLFITEGDYSFHLEDNSAATVLGIQSASPVSASGNNRVVLDLSQSYYISFDALISSGSPRFQVTVFDSATGTSTNYLDTILTINSANFTTTSTVNGFTTYSLRIGPSSDSLADYNFNTITGSGYLGLKFIASAAGAAQTGDIYIDNMQVTAIPEPAASSLLLMGGSTICLGMRKWFMKR